MTATARPQSGLPGLDIEDIYPLTALQQGMLFHGLRDPGSGLYFVQNSVVFEGGLDEEALVRAWELVFARHPVLRSTVVARGVDVPVSVVFRSVPLPLERFDWRDLDDAAQTRALEDYMANNRSRGSEFDQPSLVRLALVRLAEQTYQMLWSHHHLLLDGWSLSIVYDEVMAAYHAYHADREPALGECHPYRDYVAWLNAQDFGAAEAYWRSRLTGFGAPTPLGVDRDTGRSGYQLHAATLAEETTGALVEVARQHHLTLNTVVQGAWAFILSCYSGEDDVVFGVTTSGRPEDLPGVESIVGSFINTTPKRVAVDGERQLIDWLQQLQADQAQSRRYEHTPLVQVRSWSEVDPAREMFDSLLVFENYPTGDLADSEAVETSDLQVVADLVEEQVNYPLTLVASPSTSLDVLIGYDCGRFDPPTIERLVSHLFGFLAGVAADPRRPLSELSVLGPDERRQLLVDWNDTATGDVGATATPVHELVAARAALRPDDTALDFEHRTVTYGELEARSNRLAHYLQAQGVGPEVLVGLCLGRGVDMVVAMLGVLKAGGAYLPLDPEHPVERLRLMVADSRAELVLAHAHTAAALDTARARLVLLDDPSTTAALEAAADSPPRVAVHPDQLAYVVYTSGSTGRPKGAMVSHRSLVNLAESQRHDLGLEPDDVALQFASFSFDVAASEIFAPLAAGSTLVVASDEARRSTAALESLLVSQAISVAQIPPAAARPLAPEAFAGLRVMVTGGEAAPAELYRRWGEGRCLFNAYGPTEATVCATMARCDADEIGPPPIGAPIANVEAYVLDQSMRPVPVGVPGELVVGGVGVARGYRGRAAASAERFVAHPYAGTAGRRLYRTGDRVRWRADGQLEFLGRVDDQVKVRGHRIEPGEIEAALGCHPAVGAAVVAAWGEEDDRRLVAYVVARDATVGVVSTNELRSFLGATLPEHMVPAVFVELDHLPLTPTGKIDRRALPSPETSQRRGQRAANGPRSATEEIVIEMWAEILGHDDIGVDDSFFELGGHSLLATQLQSRVRRAFGVEPSLTELFDHPSVAGLARVVDAKVRPTAATTAITPAGRDDPAPLSFAQQRLWFLQQLEPTSVDYNVPLVDRLEGPLDVDALAAALAAVVERHEVLRTRLVDRDGIAVQAVDPPGQFRLDVVDLGRHADPEAQAEQLVLADASAPFDLAAGPLFRARLIRLGPEHHVLSLVSHHVVADEWSAGVLRRELSLLYEAFCRDESSPLAPLPIQYADFAVWQRDWLQGEVLDAQLGYWRERLAGASRLELPTDRPRPPVRSSAGALVEIEVPADTVAGLRALGREAGATMFMTLAAAFNVLLGRYADQDDVVLGTPIANRNRSEIEGLIGFFVNTLVLRTDLSGDPSFAEVVDRTRETALGAYTHQDLPFEQLVEVLQPERDWSRTPLFQVLFDYVRGGSDDDLQLESVAVSPWATPEDTTLFDLSLVLLDGDDGSLVGAFEYSTELFEAATVERLAAYLVHLLGQAAADPQRRLSELSLTDEQERHQVVVGYNDTARDLPDVVGVHELIARHAATQPDIPAIVCGDSSLTYGELDDRSDRLAQQLRDRGVGPESVVGLAMPRGLDTVVALLAVWKAGGAYLPVDPEYPPERRAFMLSDSGVQVVLDDLDDLDQASPAAALTETARPGAADAAACVLYTSGSTGVPKGVVVTHRGLLSSYVGWTSTYFSPRPGFRWLCLASVSFDVFTGDVVRSLGAGGTLVVAPSGLLLEVDQLYRVLVEQRINAYESAPRYIDELVDHVARDGRRPADLQLLVATPDTWRTSGVLQAREVLGPEVRLLTAYGLTEASVDSTASDLQGIEPGQDRPTPIGGPLPNTRVYVLDRSLTPAPSGAPGELYVAGAGLARGYAARPALTAERFVADPFAADGSRLYRTGDRARWRPDAGELEFRGRVDEQLKLRGYRIEPGEVEAALVAHPTVRTAVVVARQDAATGDERLVGYVVAADPAVGVASTSELRVALARQLPDFMVPQHLVEIGTVPLSPNGKIDRAALPALGPDRPDLIGGYVAPTTPTEAVVAGLWAEVLGVERVGVGDDFFDLGGHSLLATQVVSRLRGVFAVEVPLATLFDHPTIAELAAIVDRSGPGVPAPPMTPVSRDGPLPLSFAQQRLWFLHQLEPESTGYSVPMAVRLEGPLQIVALRAALDGVVERHEILRTRLVAVDGIARQVVDPPGPVAVPLVDLSEEPDPLAQVERRVAADLARPFDLATGPLLRVQLLRLADDDHVLSLLMHHAVSDEWSVGVLRRELSVLYEAFSRGEPSPLAPLAIQYADFAVWQRAWLEGEVLATQLDYWRERLGGAAVLALPSDRPRPAVRSSAGAVLTFDVPPAVARGLQELSRQTGATMFMTLLAGFDVLLSHYTGQDDVVVGTPIANRNRAEIEGLIGFFVNSLVLRTDLSGDPSFAEVVARVRDVALGAYAHQDLPFEQLVDALEPERLRSRTPLFQVLFVYDRDAGDPLATATVDLPQETAKFDLSLLIAEDPDGLGGAVEYSTALFDPETIERLVEQLLELLAVVAEDPRRRLSQLPLLDAGSTHPIVGAWNDTARPVPAVGGVHELVELQARRRPEATALVFGDQLLTYRELDQRANRLAHHLRGAGVGPEVVVALALERGADLVVAMLGVLKAGGAYMPLDPEYPAERLELMLRDSRAAVLLGRTELVAALPVQRMAVVALDDPTTAALVGASPDTSPGGVTRPDQLAYVMYTSGSTGRPKGIEIAHAGIVSLATAGDYVAFRPDDVVAQASPASFDAATFEIWGALANGAALVSIDKDVLLASRRLGEVLVSREVSVLFLTPAVFNQLAAEAPDGLSGLRHLVVGGDVLDPTSVGRILAGPGPERLSNGYGPTETTTFATSHALEGTTPTESVPIGGPLANKRAFVLDRWMGVLPVGVPGELYIGGVGQARGYAHRPALTAERFVPDPVGGDGGRLYRTGDLARWRPDGALDFLGRIDEQVKVRGHRIEPGEIESHLTAHAGVSEAVVVARDDDGDRRLVAYLVAADVTVGIPSTSELRERLGQHLPDYMVPGVYVELTELPLNPNGKVDRQALPAPEGTRANLATAFTAPRSPSEKLLARLWGDILGLDEVGVLDSFFDLGGHSLLATQVVSRVRDALGVELSLSALFDHPTVRGLAEVVDGSTRDLDTPPIVPVGRDGPLPLSFSQQRLWFMDQLQPGSLDYNEQLAWRLRGPLDVSALRAALTAMVERHEVLRTRLVGVDGVAAQLIDPPGDFDLRLIDVSGQPDPLAQAEALVDQDAASPFDLAAGPMLRGQLIHLGADDHVLCLGLHHVVSDEWSLEVLRRELALLYAAFRGREPAPLDPLTVQYADFAVWQRHWLQGDVLDRQLSYWRERLEGAPDLDLPTDHPRPAVRSTAGAAVTFDVSDTTVAGLRRLSLDAGATMVMVLLAGFTVTLGRWSGQDDVVVGTPVANRNRSEIEDLIGFFVNNLVLRTDLSGDPTFAEVVARVREIALGAYAHQDVPFEQLVDALEPERDRSRSPLFQALFNYFGDSGIVGREGADAGLVDLRTESVGSGEPVALCDVRLVLVDDGPGLTGAIEYNTALFEQDTVDRFAGHLVELLETVAQDPNRRLSELSSLTDEQRRQVLVEWNDTACPMPDVAGLHQLFEQQAQGRPEAPALVSGGAVVTYGELNEQAGRLAGFLQGLGVGPEVMVGLCLPRGVDLVAAMLAVLKAGGAYLPLDPEYPAERQAFMLTDSRASVVLGRSDTLDSLPTTRARTVALDDPEVVAAVQAAASASAGDGPVHPDQLAYVIYTSGSTGRPKGVQIPHRGVVNLVGTLRAGYGVTEQSVGLQFAPSSYDAVVSEVFVALTSGAALCLASAAARGEPLVLAREMADAGVTYATLPPSLMAVLDPAEVPGLATLAAAGEPLSPELASTWGRGRNLINAYGPTEVSVCSTIAGCDPDDTEPPSIGGPLANTQLYVVDPAMSPAPVGVPGELFLGGVGVARGYGSRGALTAERFVADPFAGDGGRLYRTGDRVRWRRDGQLDFLGRVDDQVKIRGHRIEPAEIESVLSGHPGLAAAAVIAPRGDGGDRRLVAYVVGADIAAGAPPATELRRFLGELLPNYMVPAVFVELDSLPLHPNDKVNRAALPVPDRIRPNPRPDHQPPRTTTEEIVASIWAEVLGLDRVGVDDNFFDLGGHSLLATQVVSRVRAVFGTDLALAELFDQPTLGGFAGAVDGAGDEVAPPPIVAVDRDAVLPLSFSQQRLWFLDQLEPGSADYNVPLVLRLEGSLDRDALAAALDAIVERHEVLRTRLVADGGVARQVVDPPGHVDLAPVDLRGEPGPLGAAQVLAAADAARPFDLSTGPLLRCRLLQLGPDDHVLSLVMHHVVSDEWSAGILSRELSVLYDAFRVGAPSPLTPLPIQYADFAAWQRGWLQGEALDSQLAYWRGRLAGAPPVELPTDRPRPAVRSSAGAVLEFDIPAEIVRGLRARGRDTGATMFMTLLAGFQVLLARYGGQDDVVVGTTIANRNRTELEGLVGFFVNTLVLRTDLAGDPTLVEVVERVRETALGAYARQELPFEQLVEELQPERDRSRTPLFQVLFDYAARSPHDELTLGDLRISGVPTPEEVSLFDLSLVLVDEAPEADEASADSAGTVSGIVEYSTALFDPPTIGRLVDHLVVVLGLLATDGDRRLSTLQLLDDDTRHQLLLDVNDTTADLPDVSVPELIAHRAATAPDVAAVVFGDHMLTYEQLDRRSTQLAHHLWGLGVGPEDVVGLCCERGLDVVVALLAVWKAGGAYLLLDPELPTDRLGVMLADSDVRVVLSHAAVSGRLPARPAPGTTVVLDDPATAALIQAEPVEAPDVAVPAAGLACVVYTSGSTGRPKGVLLTHEGLANAYAAWTTCHFTPSPGFRWLTLANVGFDVFTGDVVRALGSGGTLVVAPNRLLLSSSALLEVLVDQQVCAFECGPRFVDELVAQIEDSGARPESLRLVVVTTETWRTSGLERARAVLGDQVRLLTAYGITETTVDSTYSRLGEVPGGSADRADRATPIGGPLPNTRLYVLDQYLAPLPVGVAGDLYIGGAGVARGYDGRAGLTAERFVADPFGADGGRLYRSGDRVRWRVDHELEFLGRADQQLNLRGFRVEPGEVEAALVAHAEVAAAVVVGHRRDGDVALVAYVVPAVAAGALPSTSDLRAFLARSLPEYMVPGQFVEIDAVPTTPHGKVDRAALPGPGGSRPDLAGGYVAPRTATEEMLAGVWAEVLGVDRVGVDDNFFELGGHSLLATQVVSRLRDVFEVELPLVELFDHPTVSRLAVVVDGTARGVAAQPIVAQTDGGPRPLSFAQQRLWFLHQLEPQSVDYNVPLAVRLQGPLDTAALVRALSTVVERHEVLRTRFAEVDGEPLQLVDPPGPFELDVVDLGGEPDPLEAAEPLVAEDAAWHFDLAAGPVFQGRLLRLADDDHVLSLVMHHVVSDEWSAGVLQRELAALYEAFSQGQSSPLAPLPVQFGDVAVWQRDWLQGDVLDEHLRYWRQQLGTAPQLELPTDRPRPPVRSSSGGEVGFELPEDVVAGLRALSRQTGATMFMTLLAASSVMLGQYAQQDDVVVGTPIANRNRRETEDLIGFFTNTLVLRTDLSGDPDFAEVVGRARRAALGAYAHQDLPFEQLVEVLQPERDRSRNPLFQVFFDFAHGGGGDAELTLGELDVTSWESPSDTTLFDLSILAVEDDGRLGGTIEYSTDLFDRTTVERMVDHLVDLLSTLSTTPGQHLSQLSLLSEAEHRRTVVGWNDTAQDTAAVIAASTGVTTVDNEARGVHELVAAQAARQPDATALVFGDRSLTYGELDTRAEGLAQQLRSQGVGPEVVVGVALERGLDLVVALLGVLKAGGAYLLVDPDHPAERARFMLDDSGVSVVVSDVVPAELVAGGAGQPRTSSGQLASVIYTSGSTGRPKGVLVTHDALLHVFAAWASTHFPDESGLRWLTMASSSFDVFTGDWLRALGAGGTLVLAEPELQLSPAALVQALADEQINAFECAPRVVDELVEELEGTGQRLSALRLVVVTTDVWRTTALARARRVLGPHVRVLTGFGITEATIDSAYSELSVDQLAGDGPTPIGHALPNTQLFVVDPSLRPLPEGIPGELLIGGAGLARGYCGRPDLTAERIVADPFAGDGSRLYRSGDRVRWSDHGELEFLGRLDRQVNLRGFRIEPGEIEAHLVAHPAVSAAVVLASDDGDQRRLVAYVVAADVSAGVPSTSELRAQLGATLPEHMVPATFVELKELPLTPNGKVDRAALPAPDAARPTLETALVMPRNPIEAVLAGVWRGVLGLDELGVEDDFFDLGGHSLLATRVASRVRSAFAVELPLVDLFDHPTIAGLATVIDGLTPQDWGVSSAVDQEYEEFEI